MFHSRLTHLFRAWLLGLAFVLLSFGSSAKPTLTDYGSLPSINQLAISPNGDLVAYTRHIEEKEIIQVLSMSQRKVLFSVDVSKVQPSYLNFFDNNKLFFRASEYKRVQGFLSKFDVSTGFVLDIETQKVRQLLTPGRGIYAGQTGLGKVIGTTPDGKFALMPAFSLTDWQFPKPTYSLYKVNLEVKNSNPISVAAGEASSVDFFVNDKGEALAQEQFDDRKKRHIILARKDNKWVEIFNEETDVRYRSFTALTPDQKSLVFLTYDETQRVSYYTMSLSDGSIQGPLYSREDADIDHVITDNQRVAHGLVYSGFNPSYEFFDKKNNQRMLSVLAEFPDQSVHLISWSPDWKHFVVKVSGSSYTEDYFLFSEGESPIFLASGRPNIKEEDIHPISKIAYKARDGLNIPTLLTIPNNKVSDIKNLPAVILPHGGPASYDQIGFNFLAQALANEGYLVVQPQFRGSTGFGMAHNLAGYGEWGGKMQDDLTDAVAFFTAKGIIDPKRVCIVGASYGGYAALAGGALTPDLYRCVVSINGVSDLNSLLKSDEKKTNSRSELVAYMLMQISNGQVSKEELIRRSPQQQAQLFTAPTLLVHSQNDERVPIKQSKDMHKALQKAKKISEFVVLKGDNHFLEDSGTRLQALESTIKFVNKHLQ